MRLILYKHLPDLGGAFICAKNNADREGIHMRIKFLQHLYEDGRFCMPVIIKEDNCYKYYIRDLCEEVIGYRTFYKEMSVINCICIFGDEEDIEVHFKREYPSIDLMQEAILREYGIEDCTKVV